MTLTQPGPAPAARPGAERAAVDGGAIETEGEPSPAPQPGTERAADADREAITDGRFDSP